MELQTWKIQGRDAFHFGEHGIGQEESRVTWPSDSLFAALVTRLATLYGPEAVAQWLGTPQEPRTPPFLVTSTFPYAGEVRFFPVPKAALRPPQGENIAPEVRPKDLKKVRFVSEGIYRRLLRGLSLVELAVSDEVRRFHRGSVWVLAEEMRRLPPQPRRGRDDCQQAARRFWVVDKRPRVAVGRSAQNSNLFHVGEVRFAQGCGLWFGLQWLTEDAATRARLDALLTDLGDAGLGAERAAGYGAATLRPWDVLALPDPAGGLWTTLARYLPRADEVTALQHPAAAYDLERLSGWLDGYALRRRAVHLLREGAVLGPLDKPAPYGQAVDVRPWPRTAKDAFTPPPHPVWRSGLTVAVGYGGAR